MNILNADAKKGLAALTTAALLALSGTAAYAASGDVAITGSSHGSSVLASNGSATVLQTFSPDLDLASSLSATLEASATSSVTAYYGVDVTIGTSTPDVHWTILVHHDSAALSTGDVAISEVGTYNASTGKVRTPASDYVATESSGDLVLTSGVTGWSISSGSQFTNVDEITFAPSAPTGTYTVTRALIDEATDAILDTPFSFTVDLVAASSSGTTTPPTSTTTPPTSTTTPPTASSTSPTITLVGDNPISVRSCDSYVEPGFSAVDASGTPIAASSTSATNDIDLSQPGNYTVTYTATDTNGNVATTTRTVNVVSCTSGHSRGGGSGSSRPADNRGAQNDFSGNRGLVVAGIITGFNLPLGVGIPSTGGEVLGVATFQFVSDLQVGMTGPEVTELQTRLSGTGLYHAPITGYFGPATRAAVMTLQRNNGLSATGHLDLATRTLLNS
jgi:hypothetical protein